MKISMNIQSIKTHWVLALLLLFSISFTACDEDSDDTPSPSQDITELAQSDSRFTSLVAALTQANLVSTLQGAGPFTVFAPTNNAFSTFLSDNNFASLDEVPGDVLSAVLLNHVVAGKALSTDLATGYLSTSATEASTNNPLSAYVDLSSGVKINGISTVEQADLEASNGVIHAVDAVIGLPTVVTHALANAGFTSLVAALTRQDHTTDYVSILSGNGPFTVFAPTNDAFQALLDSNTDWNSLDDIPLATLEAVLNYHVVSGANVLSSALTDGQTVTTISNDATFTINISGSDVSITDAQNRTSNIIATDVQGVNGVVHVVDGVLLP